MLEKLFEYVKLKVKIFKYRFLGKECEIKQEIGAKLRIIFLRLKFSIKITMYQKVLGSKLRFKTS